jgi:hypothetical protein
MISIFDPRPDVKKFRDVTCGPLSHRVACGIMFGDCRTLLTDRGSHDSTPSFRPIAVVNPAKLGSSIDLKIP